MPSSPMPFADARTALSWVETLQTKVAEFKSRDDRLDATLRLRLHQSENDRTTRLKKIDDSLESSLAGLQSLAEGQQESFRAHFEGRIERLRKAHLASRQHAIRHLGESETLRRYDLQRERIHLERSKDASLQAAMAHHDQSAEALAMIRHHLEQFHGGAKRTLRGFPAFLKPLLLARKPPAPEDAGAPAGKVNASDLEALGNRQPAIEDSHNKLQKTTGARFFGVLPFPLLATFLLLIHGALWFYLSNTGPADQAIRIAVASFAGTFLLGLGFFLVIRSAIAKPAREFTRDWREAFHRCLAAEAANARWLEEEQQRLLSAHQDTVARLDSTWKGSTQSTAESREERLEQIDRQLDRAEATRQTLLASRLDSVSRWLEAQSAQREAEAEKERLAVAASLAGESERINLETQTTRERLEAEWTETMGLLGQQFGSLADAAEQHFPDWANLSADTWQPPTTFANAAPVGALDVDVPALCGPLPASAGMVLPFPQQFTVPLLLTYPSHGSLILETEGSGQEQAVAALNQVLLRLLTSSPPGRAAFTILDPVGLGENFAGAMHLADHADHLIHGRIWTQPDQIEKRLAELTEHMEKVIQMYLRNEFETITEYNEMAGNIAEKYRFLVVADFPAGFSDAAARKLLSIATSGARCGVFTLIHWDRRRPQPADLPAEDFLKSSLVISLGSRGVAVAGHRLTGATVRLEAPPTPASATALVQRVGKACADSDRVEVPFSHVAPSHADMWSLESSAELRVPIGRSGATKLQYLALGKATRQHALIAGKTGSGKSTLFHIIATNLALWYSPDEVEFYLVDFKKGVEFKCYATHRLPHARVVAIESDREFGLSVLERLDEELRRRGEIFRNLGVQDVAGYRRTPGREPMPRTLLMIDEFQEFFTEEDGIAQSASLLLDRIVRQGRAFGIHVLLGSQTLGGAYTLARATLGQMVVRIALQCNEADAYLIMDDSNPAPRLLSRPGEGIYNDTSGTIEGNSPFQTVWLPDDERDARLDDVLKIAKDRQEGRRWPGPVVFEGNVPGDITDNDRLAHWLDTPLPAEPVSPLRLWLGSPNAIKGPTEVSFDRQSGNNLLIVGQRDEAILAMFSAAMIALAAQMPARGSRFLLLDASPPESLPRTYLDRILEILPQESTRLPAGTMGAGLAELTGEMDRRLGDEGAAATAPPLFLLVHGVQRFKKLRHEDDFGFSSGGFDEPVEADPAKEFQRLLTEGSAVGIHVIASVDSYGNLTRFLGRKALGEFEKRVLFQMSANDSASLIDSTKAADLGLARALFHNEYEGTLETFRPYALPDQEWIESVGARFEKRDAAA
ncbi:MAG: hypothetical protein IT576_11830, partial [Verrucomicrobiales bacterium]|nr:hypothetical protein [Verrucomicrobiales bacterium]